MPLFVETRSSRLVPDSGCNATVCITPARQSANVLLVGRPLHRCWPVANGFVRMTAQAQTDVYEHTATRTVGFELKLLWFALLSMEVIALAPLIHDMGRQRGFVYAITIAIGL